MIHFDIIIKNLPQLLSGTKITILIAFWATIIGMCGGTVLALAQRSKIAPLRWFVHCYVSLFRGTPMLVQIVFIYYALNLPFSAVVIAIIAIGLNSSAYISQVIRSGINSVSKGEIEAAQVLGISHTQTIRFIILPQALRSVFPSLGNEFVTLIKDSSLAYIIGVNELFKQSRNLMNETYEIATVYLAITIIYLILTYTVTAALHKVEKQLERPC